MNKKIISVSCLLIIFLLILIISLYPKSNYEFNDNITTSDLLTLVTDDDELTICENCIYMVSNWDDDNYSSLLSFSVENDSLSYEKIADYDDNYTTGVGVSIEDYYEKVINYYGLKEKYAYWNVELESGDTNLYYYPNESVFNKDVKDAYLSFVYYLDDDEWSLLKPNKYLNRTNEIIDDINEYILFTFEFSFNDNSSDNQNKTVAAYSIFYYKKS